MVGRVTIGAKTMTTPSPVVAEAKGCTSCVVVCRVEGGMMAVKVITLPWPDKALHSNARTHHMAKARATKTARNLAWAKAMEAPRIGNIPNATIFVECYPPTLRGDVHNIPTALKAYIDGIADAMGCDDRDFKVDYPSVWAGSGKPGKVVFRVVPPVVAVPVVGQVIGDKVVM